MKRVLIADDAMFMRATLKQQLAKHGFEIAGEAEDGSIAVKKYKELKPDIVTMDITMPVMSGLDALKEIMAFDKSAKIVMVTALGQEEMVKQAVVAGARSFVVKPYKEESLITILNKLL